MRTCPDCGVASARAECPLCYLRGVVRELHHALAERAKAEAALGNAGG